MSKGNVLIIQSQTIDWGIREVEHYYSRIKKVEHYLQTEQLQFGDAVATICFSWRKGI